MDIANISSPVANDYDPILTQDCRRFVLFPIKYKEVPPDYYL